jgi:YfiH family protein
MALTAAFPQLIAISELPAAVCGFATTCPPAPANPFGMLNLGTHVGDDPDQVHDNRRRLVQACELPGMPRWLQQVHGVDVVEAELVDGGVRADASFTQQPGVVCAVLTADCLPVLFWNRAGTAVAAAHAGWRGLSAGVLENVVERFVRSNIPAEDVFAWCGPAIGAAAYEVDAAVRDAFLARHKDFAAGFSLTRPGHWSCDLTELARRVLQRAGVSNVHGGGWCTYTDTGLQSFRQQPECGRQSSLIYLKP